MNNYILRELPPNVDLETKVVLKQTVLSHRYLAELKGVSKTIPNQAILINTLPLLEAKDSSAIENIITTHDEIYKETLFEDFIQSAAAKEVQNYSYALRTGYEIIKNKGLFTNSQILEIQECIEKNKAGFRKLPGTELKNGKTGKTVYVPPQNYNDVKRLMDNLEKYINDDSFHKTDMLIKMAVIHFQFESIHPFYDGNGRTGRIINILYLVYKGLLDIPVLYLSRYIIRNKDDYYNFLQEVRDKENWEEWILFMLKGIEETAKETIMLIHDIRELMQRYKHDIRAKYSFYSQDLMNNLFFHPYTKIDFLAHDLKISRQTAAKYLDILAKDGFLLKERLKKSNFYINKPLFDLFVK
ncbi:MAG: Fic family protein [Spirochaetales bacterium]|nr:Fic family protein [Spirochaetales bacterium]